MKVLKLVFRIISAISLFFLVSSYFVIFFSPKYGSDFSSILLSGFLSLLPLASMSLFVGFALTFIDNKLPHYIGLGLESAGYILFLAIALILASQSNSEASLVNFILYLVAFFGYIAAIIIDVVAFVKADKPAKATGEDAAMEQLMKWKKLQENNIITEEEFEAKKKEIFINMVEEQ